MPRSVRTVADRWSTQATRRQLSCGLDHTAHTRRRRNRNDYVLDGAGGSGGPANLEIQSLRAGLVGRNSPRPLWEGRPHLKGQPTRMVGEERARIGGNGG